MITYIPSLFDTLLSPGKKKKTANLFLGKFRVYVLGKLKKLDV